MANINVIKLKVRRGTDLQRKQVVFDNGEIIYITDTDSQRLFVGDGVKKGGNSVAMKFYSGGLNTSSSVFGRAQVGDLIYDTDTTNMFILTGVNSDGFADYTNPLAYQNITVKPDNETIVYDNNHRLSVRNLGISAAQISTQAFDTQNGFTRTGVGGTFRVNIDNASIQFNPGRQLYVDPRFVPWTLLPTQYPGAGSNRMWIDTLNGNLVRIAL